MTANDNFDKDLAFSLDYLRTGGLGEMLVMASEAREAGFPRLMMDPVDAIALCILAQEAFISKAMPEPGDEV